MKPGRNDPCPCGSGKKYKKCCLLKKQAAGDGENEPARREQPEEAFDENSFWLQALTNMRRYTLDQKPHIKAYYRIRKMHGEIIDTMVQYHHDGKFEQKIDNNYAQPSCGHAPENDTLRLLHCEFDLDTREGAQAFYDMLVYKSAPNTNCITEIFLQNHRYRKEDKIAFLHSMLASTLGLFEIVGTDPDEGYAFLKEVFSGVQYTVTDVALSGTENHSAFYLYTRIIEHHGVCFGTGLNLAFSKKDAFIKQHIRQHSKGYNPNSEFLRFTLLYNHYSKSQDSINVVPNTFK